MEENKKYRNANKRVGVFCGICILGLISLCGFLQRYYIQKNGVYIICTVCSVKGARGGRVFFAKYSFRNQEYRYGGISHDIYKKDEGSRYFVQILPDNPKFLWFTGIEVPYDITEAPSGGWKELPVLDW